MPWPLAQGAHDGVCLLVTQCPLLLLTSGKLTTPERHSNMAPILLILLRDRNDRIV